MLHFQFATPIAVAPDFLRQIDPESISFAPRTTFPPLVIDPPDVPESAGLADALTDLALCARRTLSCPMTPRLARGLLRRIEAMGRRPEGNHQDDLSSWLSDLRRLVVMKVAETIAHQTLDPGARHHRRAGS